MTQECKQHKRFGGRKVTAVILLLAMLISICTVSAEAQGGNIQYPTGVTEAMCHADYWAQKAKNAQEIMMTPQEIDEYNAFVAASDGTHMVDLEQVKTTLNADALRSSLSASIKSSHEDRALFIGGEQIDNEAYFGALSKAVEDTAWTGTHEVEYGVCTSRCDLMGVPTNDIIGYSAEDPDSEFQDSAINVNDPVVIRQTCTTENGTFFYVETDHCPGWVNAEAIGICQSRSEWLDAWKVSADDPDILVVTQNRIVTEPSVSVPDIADVKLTLGTVLKLVPEDKIPENIGERGAWNNYVVYLPTRNADGKYVRKEALISQHYDVSIGFLPMTQEEILHVAFNCLGDRYGWGSMLDAMDCSAYTRNVYHCFGLRMPRNTTWQQLVPNTKIDVSSMTDEEKLTLLQNTPAGALFYLPGHTMIYTGFEADMGYVISALGSASDSVGDLAVKSIYSVAITPLNVRRRNGNTWLKELTSIVIPANYAGMKYDPAAGTDDTTHDTCPLCGKEHTGFFGKIVLTVHRIVYRILRLFSVRLPIKTTYPAGNNTVIE